MDQQKMLDSLAAMRQDAENEIGELNLYMNGRDDLPTWKVTELKDRIRSLEVRKSVIDELVAKFK